MKKLTSIFLAMIVIISTSAFAGAAKQPDFDFNTESLLLVNMDTDEVLYSQNADEIRTMASTTKIMTYIITAETIDDLVNTKIKIEQQPINDVLNQDASMAGFQNHVGESYSVLDILYGLMIPSGCDAAQILAYYIGDGSAQNFVDMMNEKALQLGCVNTHFNDAHGLSEENHYSTAEDMYKIAKYALDMPYFKEMVATEYYTLPGDSVPLVNTNYLIDFVNGGRYYYQYATGIKTGFTDAAGKCLVSTAKKGDTNLMCVALGGKYDAETGYVNYAMTDTVSLYKWAFENFTDNIDVTLNARYRSVQLGEQLKLNAEITGSNIDAIPVIKWSSSDESVATVDQDGVVTAVSMGEALIKAETQTGNFDVCNVGCGYYNGIDVTSRYGDYTSGEKEPIDWKAVKDSGIDFAIIRAGWGSEDYPSQNDASFVENVKGAIENGIPIGLNFVAYAENKETARLEAEYLLREINEYIPEYKDFIALPVSYNMTDAQFREFTPEQNTEIALEFNRVMNENGYKTMCYANKSVFAKMNVEAIKNSGMDLWYAYYPYKADFSEKILVNEKYEPEVWQYRTDGYMPEASEALNTKQSIIYMLSTELDQYMPPKVTAKQVENEQAAEIAWESVDYDISGYAVYRQAVDGGELEKIADLSAEQLKYTDTDLKWGDCYTYFVAAKAVDFLDKTYVKEILGAAETPVEIKAPAGDITEPETEQGSEAETQAPTDVETVIATEPASSDGTAAGSGNQATDGTKPEAPTDAVQQGKGDVNTGGKFVSASLLSLSLAAAFCLFMSKKRAQ